MKKLNLMQKVTFLSQLLSPVFFNNPLPAHYPSYLLPRLIGDTGTPQLCLRDVDIDLTRIGKLSLSRSPSNSIAVCSISSCDAVIPLAGSIDPTSPFRFIVKLSPTEGSEESPVPVIQLGSN